MKRCICFLLSLVLVVGLGTPSIFTAHAGEPAPAPTVDITLDKDSVAVGETITASWVCHNLPEGWHTNASWIIYQYCASEEAFVSNVFEASYTPDFGLYGEIEVHFVDAGGNSQEGGGSKRFEITGWEPEATQPPIPENMQFTINLSTDTVEVGTPITATWTLSNVPADWDLGVTAIWNVSESNGNNYSKMEHPNAATGTTTFTPPFGSSGSLQLEAYDNNWGVGKSVGSHKRFTVTGSTEAPKLIISGGLNPATATLGSPITASWTVEGGVAPYTYTYHWFTEGDTTEDGTFSGDLSTTETSVTFTPIKGHSGYFYIEVRDMDGRFTFTEFSFSLKPAPATPTPTVEPTLEPTEVPTEVPTRRPTQAPAPAPKAEELAQSVVSDDTNQSVPFKVATTQDSAGKKALVITAFDDDPSDEQPMDETIVWKLTPALVQAAAAEGMATVSAQRGTVSVVLEVEKLDKESTQDVVITIRQVKTDTLSEAVQQQLAADAAEEVYEVSIDGIPADELVQMAFALDANASGAVVVEIHPETGEVLLPETTITEDGDGLRTAHAMVHNGALCYLRTTPVTP